MTRDVVYDIEGHELLQWYFYCDLCNTWFHTDGRTMPTADELAIELQEHKDELHD